MTPKYHIVGCIMLYPNTSQPWLALKPIILLLHRPPPIVCYNWRLLKRCLAFVKNAWERSVKTYLPGPAGQLRCLENPRAGAIVDVRRVKDMRAMIKKIMGYVYIYTHINGLMMINEYSHPMIMNGLPKLA